MAQVEMVVPLVSVGFTTDFVTIILAVEEIGNHRGSSSYTSGHSGRRLDEPYRAGDGLRTHYQSGSDLMMPVIRYLCF